jgi:hypothetical protein
VRESWCSKQLPALTRYGRRGLSERLMFFLALLSQLHKEFRAALLLKDEALSRRSLGDLLSVTDTDYDPLQLSGHQSSFPDISFLISIFPVPGFCITHFLSSTVV